MHWPHKKKGGESRMKSSMKRTKHSNRIQLKATYKHTCSALLDGNKEKGKRNASWL